MSEVRTAATTVETRPAGDDLDHFYCPRNPDLGMCGCDLTNATEEPDTPANCVVCVDLNENDLWCPLPGHDCDCWEAP